MGDSRDKPSCNSSANAEFQHHTGEDFKGCITRLQKLFGVFYKYVTCLQYNGSHESNPFLAVAIGKY